MSDVDLATLAELVRRPEVPLAQCCLLVASHLGHPTPVEESLGSLERMADAVPEASLEAVAFALLGPGGLSGNHTDYHDPANSLLPEVLRRRTGIPITLAVVVIDVARRRGLAAVGVGMPGHFLVGDGAAPARWIDAFAGPGWIDRVQAEARFRAVLGVDAPFSPRLLEATPDPLVVARVCRNLTLLYDRAGDARSALRTHELLDQIPGPDGDRRRRLDHAVALASVGRFADAADRLDRLAADGPDLDEQVRAGLSRRVRELRSRHN